MRSESPMRLAAEMLRVALVAIWANKLRSFLTLLGNIVAVMSIITVTSLIQGTNDAVADAIMSDVGADSFEIERTGPTMSEAEVERARGNPRVTLEDADAIRRSSTAVGAVMAQASRRGEVRFRNETLESVQIRGVTREYVDFPTFSVERGRLMTPTEVDRNRNVAVIGWDTADRLFGESDPIDRRIKVQGVHYRIVGVAERQGATFGQSQDEFVIIPLGSYFRLFGTQQSLAVRVRPTDPSRLETAMDEATVALRIERRLKPREDNNFGMFTSESMLGIYDNATRGIFTVLVGVVSLSLVVGGIVIMNIMLMTVSERTREIGLRKALGARRRDVLWQILAESMVLSTLGGVVGTALGAAAAGALAAATPVPAAVHGWSVALAILTTSLVGLFFGLYPASRAARLDPIAALQRGE
jgi:putative ABC transport system permease protein